MERLYLDTSVFGGYFDPEFELWTQILFEQIIKGKYRLLYSTLSDEELALAPDDVKNLVLKIPDTCIEVVEITAEAIELATSLAPMFQAM